ncbi:tryptophan halogenase family protein [Sandarakinorhabdus sp.]|uniref:tryptophan halogenase family protein n=1 Tax=Sandarakinorhabdus sp. TaxID=1916663 RepID=UPI003342B43F
MNERNSDPGVEHVVILGGGTAGWLAACVLAASARARGENRTHTLIEAPDIPTVGVGEGTWPTMRGTLAAIGIDEAEFLSACDASFKQGSRFDGWVDGGPSDSYLHPFTPPPPGESDALVAAWAARRAQHDVPFAAAMTAQAAVVAANLAPRQASMPGYAGALNYAYHLDAGKFAALLQKHATGRLGVRHVAARVTAVIPGSDGDIAALTTDAHGDIEGDLFVDCSGHAGVLISGHLGVEWVDRSDVLLNDSAMAVQVPVRPDSAIASATIATAHSAGWLWDIGLPGRRGIGCIYSSRFMDDDGARQTLLDYIAASVPGADVAALSPRKLAFRTGHRARFWQGNCIAIGLSAGFLEPLEASAIVMIELSLQALCANFPKSRRAMAVQADRFNALFSYRWDRIVEFLKLHYLPSRRTEAYWLAQRDPAQVPPRLRALLDVWRDQPPSQWDFPQAAEIFPAESHAYVLYGMGFAPPAFAGDLAPTQARLDDLARRTRALVAALPANRTLFPLVRAPQPFEGRS